MGLTHGPWWVRNRCGAHAVEHWYGKTAQESIQSIAGLEIVTKIAIDLGARRVSEDLNQRTDGLVLCGPKVMWKYGWIGF